MAEIETPAPGRHAQAVDHLAVAGAVFVRQPWHRLLFWGLPGAAAPAVLRDIVSKVTRSRNDQVRSHGR
jgi:hypothetical protein